MKSVSRVTPGLIHGPIPGISSGGTVRTTKRESTEPRAVQSSSGQLGAELRHSGPGSHGGCIYGFNKRHCGARAVPLCPPARRSLPERTEVTCMNGARGRIPFRGRESRHRGRKGPQEQPPLRAQTAGRREAARGGSQSSDAGRHPPAPGPRGAAFFQSQRSRPPRGGAEPLARPQSRLVSPERPGDVTRAGRAQPATFRAQPASRPPPLRAAGMSCAPSRRRRHPTAGRAPRSPGSRASARPGKPLQPAGRGFRDRAIRTEDAHVGGHAHLEARTARAPPRV